VDAAESAVAIAAAAADDGGIADAQVDLGWRVACANFARQAASELTKPHATRIACSHPPQAAGIMTF
jgi:hypothetical protein